MNSLLSNVHTTYGSLLGLRFRASWIRTTIFPFGGPTVGVACATDEVDVVEVDPDVGVIVPGAGRVGAGLLVTVDPFRALPAEVVPRGVAGGVSFPSRRAEAVSLNESFSRSRAKNEGNTGRGELVVEDAAEDAAVEGAVVAVEEEAVVVVVEEASE